MLKSEKFIRDTFSGPNHQFPWFNFKRGWFSWVKADIKEEYTGDPYDEKYCISAQYNGIIFGSPFIDMVFDDRYHSKSLVRKRFKYGEAKLDGVVNLTLNPKNDSISFEDKSGNKYTLFPRAYNRRTVIYFDKNGTMCVVYCDGEFNLDESSEIRLNK